MTQSIIPSKVNLAAAFDSISGYWQPKIAGDINDFQVKIAKISGQFDWHQHEVEDELFLVIKGRMRMGLRTGDVDLDEGEMIIIPHGTDHRPEALTEECHILMLEPNTTLNTGNIISDRTVKSPERL